MGLESPWSISCGIDEEYFNQFFQNLVHFHLKNYLVANSDTGNEVSVHRPAAGRLELGVTLQSEQLLLSFKIVEIHADNLA